ncbi:MAG: DUF3179 domain-containing (seleno)protein [Haloarculaceae archaeon]
MNRRAFLAALGASTALAGCLTGRPSAGGTDEESTPTPGAAESTAQESTGGLAEYGIPPTICEESIESESGIYAITDPSFEADWTGYEVDSKYRYDGAAGLVDDQTVIGLATEAGARAYPLTILTTHEAVNDTFGGPVLVTFCPICRSGMVADRRLSGETTRFAVSGLLWQPERIQSEASEETNRTFGASATGGEEVSVRHSGNLVLYDAVTRSYWSQILARGICGPHAGTDLDVRPSTVATWGEWRAEHPKTEVLLPPPYSGTVEPGEVLGGVSPGSSG